ncbi:hypothetical protein LTS10_012989 [Elasticomyces elasticus]|nr:hypothetical protein LTS10_012989 [Elasticomyces elasticus]
MATTTTAVQVLSISLALFASGGIATLSLFDVPALQSQPASRSLPITRWLFSRGSHTAPQAAAISSAGFGYLAYSSLPRGVQLTDILSHVLKGGKVSGYLAAAILAISIAPMTGLMIPTNFALIKKNEDLGGAPSKQSAKEGYVKPGQRSAEDSVNARSAKDELTDLSNPQGRTEKKSSAEDDREVRELLGKFGRLNGVRAALIGVAGVVGLVTALAV